MRWVLRKTLGPWSAGTPVTIYRRTEEGGFVARPWPSPETLVVAESDLVRRRRGSDLPPQLQNAPPPKYVRVDVPERFERDAEQLGIRDVEGQIERRVRAGDTWGSLPWWLGGKRFDDGRRCVYLQGGPGAVVVLARAPSDSKRVHLLRVVDLVSKRPRGVAA